MISRILRRFLTSRPPAPEPPPRAIIGEIGEPFTSVLGSMYDGEPQLGADGQMHELDPLTRIRQRQGLWLYQLIREEKPDETLGRRPTSARAPCGRIGNAWYRWAPPSPASA